MREWIQYAGMQKRQVRGYEGSFVIKNLKDKVRGYERKQWNVFSNFLIFLTRVQQFWNNFQR